MTTPVPLRAGTTLDHRFTKRVGKFGHIDTSQDLYQVGGKKRTMVLWKDRVLGLGLVEWMTATMHARVFEFIEHQNNECWFITIEKAERVGWQYTINGKTRFGIPINAFDVWDANGNLVQKATL